MTPDPRSQYRFSDYAKALRTHYRDFATDPESIRYIENVAASCEALQPRPDRFQQLQQRNFGSAMNAWHACRGTVPTGVASGYKGLLRIKTPFDLVLYQNLVWELRPKTILEFGSLQGGSGLWFSDLMDTYDIEGGEVHSFDLFSKCISPMAKHPRLRFHSCNLYELETLDDGLLSRLPHPWLVIDDAHVNVLDVTLKVDRHVQAGDYYVLEDIGLSPTIAFVEGLQKICAQGYAIDSDYADAFGYNVTSAPNGWLRKMHRA